MRPVLLHRPYWGEHEDHWGGEGAVESQERKHVVGRRVRLFGDASLGQQLEEMADRLEGGPRWSEREAQGEPGMRMLNWGDRVLRH